MLYLLNIFNPSSWLFRVVAGAALVGGLLFGWHVFKKVVQKPIIEQCERDKSDLQTTFVKITTDNNQKAQAAYAELSQKQQGRDRIANAKIQQAKVNRAAIEFELAGVRESVPTNAAVIGACANPEKLTGFINTYDSTLGRCEGRYIEMAERATRAEEAIRAVAPEVLQFEQEVKNFEKGLFK